MRRSKVDPLMASSGDGLFRPRPLAPLSVYRTQIIHSSSAISPFYRLKEERHINHHPPKSKWFDHALYLLLIFIHSSFSFFGFLTLSRIRIRPPHTTASVVIPFRPRAESQPLARGGRMLQNLIWSDDSILRGRAIRMQSTVPIQPLAQNSLSSSSVVLTLPRRFTISSITVGCKRRLIS